MKYTPTDVAGVTIIDIEPHRDDGGFFSHAFCANEFAAYGLISNVAQTNISYNYGYGRVYERLHHDTRRPSATPARRPVVQAGPLDQLRGLDVGEHVVGSDRPPERGTVSVGHRKGSQWLSSSRQPIPSRFMVAAVSG